MNDRVLAMHILFAALFTTTSIAGATTPEHAGAPAAESFASTPEPVAAPTEAKSVASTPEPVAAPTATPTGPASPPLVTTADPTDRPAPPLDRPPRRLRISGYVALGLGAALLGLMVPSVVAHVVQLRRLTATEAALAPGERLDELAWQRTQWQLRDIRFNRDLAIGSGVAAGVSLALGITLFSLARGRTRDRITVAPWWLSSGTGLSLRVRLP